MTTNELAKGLDALARALRSLTSEASAVVSTALELDRRRGYLPANKFEPKALTVAAISAAIATATRRPTAAVELRSDVFDRRSQRNADAFAVLAERAVRRGAAAPAGERLHPRFTRLPAGGRSLYDATPKHGRTAINADESAWVRAAALVLVRLVPGYGYNEISSFATRAHPGDAYIQRSRLEEKIRGALFDWVEANTVIIADVGADGMVMRFHGFDWAPFIEVRKAVDTGNADPLGILKTF